MTSATPADRTPQEQLWAGEFGNDYITRNRDGALLDNNRALFDKILSHTQGVTSAIEFGANIGNNLRALRDLLPEAELHSVEINATAAAEIEAWGGATVEVASLLDFEPSRQWDLSFTKGVLIHLPPEALPGVYDKLVAASSRYVMVCEYYNPTPRRGVLPRPRARAVQARLRRRDPGRPPRAPARRLRVHLPPRPPAPAR